MKHHKSLLYLGATVLLAVYHVVFFLSFPLRMGPFWISYGFTLTAFALEFLLLLRPVQAARRVPSCNLPLYVFSAFYTVIQLILGIFMTAFFVRKETAVIIQALLLGVFLLLLFAVLAGVGYIERVEQGQRQTTVGMQKLIAQTVGLSSLTNDPEMKKKLKQFEDAAAYSDPVGSSTLSEMERRLQNGVCELRLLLEQEKLPLAETKLQELQSLLIKRNERCKQTKGQQRD